VTTPTTPPPLAPGQLRTFDAFVAQLQPNTYANELEISQEVRDAAGVLASVALSKVSLQILDPAAGPLPADEILAVYPARGAEDATEVMLPHIVLKARALPWACQPISPASTWLGLLLFAGEAVSFDDKAGKMTCPMGQLKAILPRKAELDLLCHVRELPADDPLAARDDDRHVAIVAGNRLPPRNAACEACLVDLRDLPAAAWPEGPAAGNTPVTLKVLHRWSFRTASGGDFEAYWGRLRSPGPNNPTGGVRAFGQATSGAALDDDDGGFMLAAPLPDEPERRVRYHGPLCPFPRDLFLEPADSADSALGLGVDSIEVVGHAAAFELGRMLALSTPRVLDALMTFRDNQFRKDLEVPLYQDDPPGPGLLDRIRGSIRDVIINPANPWSAVQDDLWSRTADPTGILNLVDRVPGLSSANLGQLGGLQLDQRLRTLQTPGNFAPTGPGLPAGIPDLAGVDLGDAVLGDILHSQFADLPAAVAAVGLHLDEELP
jgi:hypothetical protein